MKTIKHNLLWALLLCATVAFGQKQEQKYSENFKVNKDVVIELTTSFTDVIIEEWDKNEVSISGVLEVDGVTKEEASEYFEGWNMESLGNKTKVVITSQPNGQHHYAFMNDFDFDFDFGDSFDFDFEPMIHIANIPNIMLDSSLMNFPDMPLPVIDHIAEIEFDNEAYEKDGEKYMKEFENQMETWAKEFEEKFEPQMEAYEKKMEAWAEKYEKSIEPQMEEFENKMEIWEKEFEEKFEPQMKEYEKKMENHAKKMEEQAKKMEKKIEEKYAKSMKMKKRIVIKIPKGAVVKLNVHHGTLDIPDSVTTK